MRTAAATATTMRTAAAITTTMRTAVAATTNFELYVFNMRLSSHYWFILSDTARDGLIISIPGLNTQTDGTV